jgi:hypothetical protein
MLREDFCSHIVDDVSFSRVGQFSQSPTKASEHRRNDCQTCILSQYLVTLQERVKIIFPGIYEREDAKIEDQISAKRQSLAQFPSGLSKNIKLIVLC